MFLKAWLNPLDLPELDSSSAETILWFHRQPDTPDDAESFVERSKRISEEQALRVVPELPRILRNLVWPLRNAKASYIVGHNRSAIALCGFVAEMVAVLLWKLAETKLNDQMMGEGEEKALFGRSVEKLGQERRVKILAAYGIVEPDCVADFDTIRKVRNQYLHSWSHDHGHDQVDAEKCFRAATRLAERAIGPMGYEDGKVVLQPKLVSYLEQKGTIRAPDGA